MGSNTHELVWPKFEPDEQDLFSCLTQLSYPDISYANRFDSLEWENGMALQESCFDGTPPPIESLPDNSCALMDVVPTSNLIQGDVFWDELNSCIYEAEEKQCVFLSKNGGEEGKSKVFKRYKEEKRDDSKILSRATISSYFYLPITQAAKELNVGLTFLKKRCRELGIRRWPHRKLMSLQTLIKNLHEYEREKGVDSEGKLRESTEILERERKLMEEIPDMEMEDQTKRLRQACFKANYKRRKFMGGNYNFMDAHSSSFAVPGGNCTTGNVHENGSVEHQDMKALCFQYTPPLIPTNILE